MQYEWTKAMGLADFVLREVLVEQGDTAPNPTYAAPKGFIMKSGPTSYTAWIPNDAGNRMEFFDVETAKAWVFTQVRMNDGAALLHTDSLR
jgi:hypothetical protein